MALTLQQQITALYDAAFNRPPDAAGLAHHIDLITSGQLDLYSVADAFAASAEFAAGTGLGGTPSVIVQRLYSNALNRAGSVEESSAWLDLLYTGRADMGDALAGFALSAEYATLVGWHHDAA
ncbi:DUF4214 domain-containing protein [Pannonibacter sp. SL95]|uniref:DUF4214 domain-containing protein n=1 Tax=Pannonibacter sp. SL95 TaxID=2995153 RepID=UPI002275ED8E|nr:DUF4214 domain-containing protein [Pannonibacter sp. SL95]MCY1707687.1 DUF4214 domain-containing protein [Pannonibacter sp. SL95]MCY1707753.1 DUF4214 domain-containing protein [Pannonibacter sp. SL95]